MLKSFMIIVLKSILKNLRIQPIYLLNQVMLIKFIVTVITTTTLPNYQSIKETV